MIVVDTTFLVLMIDPGSALDGDRRAERVRHFADRISREKIDVTIPAPCIAELVAGRAERVEEIVESVRTLKTFIIQPFDTVIAIEAGERIAAATARIPVHERLPGWKNAMKYDAMIAATAIARGASELYTADNGFDRYLAGSSVKIRYIDDLELPQEDPQKRIEFPNGR